MLKLLHGIVGSAKRPGLREPHHVTPTHDSMLREHEKRKGDELHRRRAHARQHLFGYNFYG